jgi:hypothetical protein
MPEYMDVHRNMKSITPEDLMQAHQADLDVQDQENASVKQAWGRPGDRHRLLPFRCSEQGGGYAHPRAGWSSDRRGVRVQGHGLTRDQEDGVPRNPSWSQRGILSQALCPGQSGRGVPGTLIGGIGTPSPVTGLHPIGGWRSRCPRCFSQGSAPWVGPPWGCHRRSPRENS